MDVRKGSEVGALALGVLRGRGADVPHGGRIGRPSGQQLTIPQGAKDGDAGTVLVAELVDFIKPARGHLLNDALTNAQAQVISLAIESNPPGQIARCVGAVNGMKVSNGSPRQPIHLQRTHDPTGMLRMDLRGERWITGRQFRVEGGRAGGRELGL